MADIVFKYFPRLNTLQKEQFRLLEQIYSIWNAKVNTISRKDFEFFYEHHVLHSLSIGALYPFESDSAVLDFGTGGGFPGIPLAILFPQVNFTLVDSIAKKIRVVESVSNELGLKNVKTKRSRVEELNESFDYITGRAVKEIPQILRWVLPLLNKESQRKNSGIIYIKGGDFQHELIAVRTKYSITELKQTFDEPYFETKKVIRFYL